MRELEPTRRPSRALAGAIAVGVLAVAALLSGPIFGPSAAGPSAPSSGDGQPRDALVRGRSLDGTMEIGFGDALHPALEMQLDGGEAEELVPGWSLYHADIARVQETGCSSRTTLVSRSHSP